MAAPKGRGSWTLCSSSLHISRFVGVRDGGHDAVHGPLPVALRSPAISLAAAALWGEGHAPVVAVLLASA
jgi:hypothetical protein